MWFSDGFVWELLKELGNFSKWSRTYSRNANCSPIVGNFPQTSWYAPNKTIGNGLKDCLPSENNKTFWKKVSLLLVLLLCVRSVLPLSTIYDFFCILRKYCRRLQVLPDTFVYTTMSWISVASLVASNCGFLLRLWQHILRYWLNNISSNWQPHPQLWFTWYRRLT